MVLLLTILSSVLALIFLGALIFYVRKIVHLLEGIGSGEHGKSALEMITWGVRAIEIETRHIPTQVGQLNSGLSVVADRLGQIDQALVSIAGAALDQPRYR